MSRERGLLLQIRAEREDLAAFLAAGQLVDDSDCDDLAASAAAAATVPAGAGAAVWARLPPARGARLLPPPADACPIAQLARERREELRRRRRTLRELEEALASAPRLVQ